MQKMEGYKTKKNKTLRGELWPTSRQRRVKKKMVIPGTQKSCGAVLGRIQTVYTYRWLAFGKKRKRLKFSLLSVPFRTVELFERRQIIIKKLGRGNTQKRVGPLPHTSSLFQ